MKRYLLVVIVMLFASSSLFAQVGPPLQQDPDPPCWGVPPEQYESCMFPDGTGSGGSTACTKGTSYATCTANCECTFKKNKQKCKENVSCLQTATLENEACLGNCLADY